MAKLTNSRIAALNALFAAGTVDKEIVKETGLKLSTVKASRMNYDAEVAANFAAEQEKEELLKLEGAGETNELAAMMANDTTPVVVVAPAAPKATRVKQDPKDLTKRDVVAVVSKSLNQCYICTSIKYSATAKGAELLKKDMLKRAALVELANAADFEFIVLLKQGAHTEAQVNKLRNHIAYANKGFTMKSSKGRGAEVKALLATIAAEDAAKEPAAETVAA